MSVPVTQRGALLCRQQTRRCRDPACDSHLWRVKHELQLAQARVTALEQRCRANGLPLSAAGARLQPAARPDDIMDSNHVRRSVSADRLPGYPRPPESARDATQHFYSRWAAG